MSDNTMNSIDGKSLAQLASFKGGINSDGPDARLRMSVQNTTRRASFDGFLNAFLGKSADASGKATKSASGPGTSAGSGLKPSDKESLKKSMDKTVAADGSAGGGAEGEGVSDEDVAAAAEEAAVLIWNLLYGLGEGAAVANSVPDSLKQLASMLNAQGGGQAGQPGQSGLGMDAVQGALETANASAEMNSAAILATVDELLEGMPRHVLDDALARMSGQLGLPASGFEGVLAMLKGQVVGVNTASNQNLLGMLSASANPALNAALDGALDGAIDGDGAAANPALAAESAGESGISATLKDLLKKFLSENEAVSASGKSSDEVANEFVNWLKETGKSSALKGFPAEANKLAEALFGSAEQKNQSFSEILKNLENALQSNENEAGQRQNNGFVQPNASVAQHPGQTATVQNTQAASVSTMLQQMENIERLSEAMKLATRGGVNNITMQLAPAELGRLMLRVESKNGVVSAKLKVEKKEAAEQLGANIHRLKESLKALGIELGDVEIEHRPPPDAPGLLVELEDGEAIEEETFSGLFA